MREWIVLLLAVGMVACSGGNTGATDTGSGTAGTTGGDSDGDSGVGGSGTSSGGIPVSGTPLGMVCDQDHLCHDAQSCVSSVSGGTSFCTIACGVSPGSAKTPPDGGPELCAEAQTYGGTAACDLTIKNKNGTLTWDCGLECGKTANNDYGDCPTGLSCSSKNICQ
jgi:hypothetical protein